MSTTAEIREALEHIRRGTTEEFTATQADRAIALLADMEREREVAAWMRKAGVGRSEYVHPEAKKNCPECWSEYSTPLYTHPSPTAADAKDSAVDVQEVIRAGDAMANRLNSMETGAGLRAVWNELTKPFRP